MLTIEEIKKELDAGREVELECVDRDEFESNFKEDRVFFNQLDVLKLPVLSVSKVGEFTISFKAEGCENIYISEENIKYFRIKRPTPTFDDLIDAVVEGCNKGLFVITMDVDGFSISKTVRGDTHHFSKTDNENSMLHSNKGIDIEKDFSEIIDFINSLYTETFVIESEKDMNNCKEGCKIIFTNGTEGEFLKYHESVSKAGILFTNTGDWFNIPFELLKGATVTQKRGK